MQELQSTSVSRGRNPRFPDSPFPRTNGPIYKKCQGRIFHIGSQIGVAIEGWQLQGLAPTFLFGLGCLGMNEIGLGTSTRLMTSALERRAEKSGRHVDLDLDSDL